MGLLSLSFPPLLLSPLRWWSCVGRRRNKDNAPAACPRGTAQRSSERSTDHLPTYPPPFLPAKTGPHIQKQGQARRPAPRRHLLRLALRRRRPVRAQNTRSERAENTRRESSYGRSISLCLFPSVSFCSVKVPHSRTHPSFLRSDPASLWLPQTHVSNGYPSHIRTLSVAGRWRPP